MASNDIRKCTVGIKFDIDCHKKSYCKDMKTIFMENLSSNEKELLQWQTNLYDATATICLHHKEVYLKRFSATQSSCCDPKKHHTKSGKKRKGKILYLSYTSFG